MSRSDLEIHRAIASLQRLAELFAERRRALARGAGLSETQWQVLEEVAEEHFMPSMFARRRDCSAASVSRTLRQLAERGWLHASIDAQDGRQRIYRLTSRGRRQLRLLRRRRERAIAEIWENFSSSELSSFTRFAERLSKRLEDYPGER